MAFLCVRHCVVVDIGIIVAKRRCMHPDVQGGGDNLFPTLINLKIAFITGKAWKDNSCMSMCVCVYVCVRVHVFDLSKSLEGQRVMRLKDHVTKLGRSSH